ncbi:MAG: hypothetical protein ACYC9Y_13135 [Candidatus Methylomirabilia bacterium]
MKKGVLFLALLVIVSLGGCTHDKDLADTITSGIWRVGDYADSGDDETWRFNGYVFTFLADGTVTVTRPALPPVAGTWNEFNYDNRLELDFGNVAVLDRLNEPWVVDRIQGDEVQLHKILEPATLVRFDKF